MKTLFTLALTLIICRLIYVYFYPRVQRWEILSDKLINLTHHYYFPESIDYNFIISMLNVNNNFKAFYLIVSELSKSNLFLDSNKIYAFNVQVVYNINILEVNCFTIRSDFYSFKHTLYYFLKNFNLRNVNCFVITIIETPLK